MIEASTGLTVSVGCSRPVATHTEFEILDPIVLTIPVLMMHRLISRQFASKSLRHDVPVFQAHPCGPRHGMTLADIDLDVSMLVDVAPTLPVVIRRASLAVTRHVARDKRPRLTFDMASAPLGLYGERSYFATTTFAKFHTTYVKSSARDDSVTVITRAKFEKTISEPESEEEV